MIEFALCLITAFRIASTKSLNVTVPIFLMWSEYARKGIFLKLRPLRPELIATRLHISFLPLNSISLSKKLLSQHATLQLSGTELLLIISDFMRASMDDIYILKMANCDGWSINWLISARSINAGSMADVKFEVVNTIRFG